jgi:hypothetical protein
LPIIDPPMAAAIVPIIPGPRDMGAGIDDAWYAGAGADWRGGGAAWCDEAAGAARGADVKPDPDPRRLRPIVM